MLQLLTRQRAQHLAGSGWYGVVLEAGEIRGQAALVPMPMMPERLEIVLWLEPAACGRGLGHRVVELLFEVAFEALDLPLSMHVCAKATSPWCESSRIWD